MKHGHWKISQNGFTDKPEIIRVFFFSLGSDTMWREREKGESLIIVIEKRIHIGLGYIYTC